MHKAGGSPRCPAMPGTSPNARTRGGGGGVGRNFVTEDCENSARLTFTGDASRARFILGNGLLFPLFFFSFLPFSHRGSTLVSSPRQTACRLYVSVSARQSTRSACSIGDDERIARATHTWCVYMCTHEGVHTRWWTSGGGDALARGRPCLDNAITSLNFLSRRLTSVTGGARPGKLDSRNNKIYFSARALWYARPCASLSLSLSLSSLSCTFVCQRAADMRRITRRNVRGRAYAPGLCMPRLYTDHAQRRA